MPSKAKVWTHPKYKDAEFKGTFRKAGDERVFILIGPVDSKGKSRKISFEGPHEAKKDGWVAK